MAEERTAAQKAYLKALILESLEKGSTRSSAAQAANINTTTMWRWRQADEEFDKGCQEAELASLTIVEDALYKKAVEGNVIAQIFLLKCRAPHKWTEYGRHDGGGDGGKLKIIRSPIRCPLDDAATPTPTETPDEKEVDPDDLGSEAEDESDAS